MFIKIYYIFWFLISIFFIFICKLKGEIFYLFSGKKICFENDGYKLLMELYFYLCYKYWY